MLKTASPKDDLSETKKVTAAGLANFAGCKDLETLYIWENEVTAGE